MSDAETQNEESTPAVEDQPEADADSIVNASALPKEDPTRKRAERTATPLSYQTLLLKGSIDQEFEVNRHLRVKMRSISAGTGEFLGKQLAKQYDNEWGVVFEEAARIYYLASCLETINGNAIGGENFQDQIKRGETDEALESFEERLSFIRGLVGSMMYLLYNHYLLFSVRVDEFVKGDGDELGNS